MSEFFLYDEDLSDNESTFSEDNKSVEIVNKSNNKITLREDFADKTSNIDVDNINMKQTIPNKINNYSSKQTITNNTSN